MDSEPEQSDSDSAGNGPTRNEARQVHAPSEAVETPGGDENRMLARRSPVDRSRSGLVSHDYQPRNGGPELVASWPLGPAPGTETEGVEDWSVSGTDPIALQRNFLQLPYLGPIDHSPLYLNVMGEARVDAGGTLRIELANRNLSGKPYEFAVDLTNEERQPFVVPMVEVAPETDEHGELGKSYGGYELRASVSDSGVTGYVDPGTTVQLWSE
jgi:hypothetical protein